MHKQFIIPRGDIIDTRNKPSEDDNGYNSFSNHPTGTEEKADYNAFSNHPTDKKKWSRDMLVGKDHPLLRYRGRQNRM